MIIMHAKAHGLELFWLVRSGLADRLYLHSVGSVPRSRAASATEDQRPGTAGRPVRALAPIKPSSSPQADSESSFLNLETVLDK
jgi:hypothetical protein